MPDFVSFQVKGVNQTTSCLVAATTRARKRSRPDKADRPARQRQARCARGAPLGHAGWQANPTRQKDVRSRIAKVNQKYH